MLRIIVSFLALLAVVTVAVLGLRGARSTRPPLQTFGDMADQGKYKAQAEGAFFADGRAMRLPPAGAVPYGRSATTRPDGAFAIDDAAFYGLTAFPAEVVKGRPLVVNEALLNRGRQQFTIYCSGCHGGTGSGDGITTKYGLIVPSYHTERSRVLSVGEVYRIITEGRGLMGPQGPNVRPEDRWAVIAYVRALQLARNTPLTQLEPRERDLAQHAEAKR